MFARKQVDASVSEWVIKKKNNNLCQNPNPYLMLLKKKMFNQVLLSLSGSNSDIYPPPCSVLVSTNHNYRLKHLPSRLHPKIKAAGTKTKQWAVKSVEPRVTPGSTGYSPWAYQCESLFLHNNYWFIQLQWIQICLTNGCFELEEKSIPVNSFNSPY